MIAGGVINTPSRSLIRDIINFAEQRDTEAILLQKEIREKYALLNTRRERKKRKRVILKGQIIVSRDSIIRDVGRIDSSDEEEEESKNELASLECFRKRSSRSYLNLKF
jgi:hypothetical protein